MKSRHKKPKARISLVINPLIDEGYGKVGEKSEFSFNVFEWTNIVYIHRFLENFVVEEMEAQNDK